MGMQYIICVTELEQNIKEKRPYTYKEQNLNHYKNSTNVLVHSPLIYTIAKAIITIFSTHYAPSTCSKVFFFIVSLIWQPYEVGIIINPHFIDEEIEALNY